MNIKTIAAFIIVPALIGGAVLTAYLSGGRFVTTENAYVQTGIATIAARTSGQVSEVRVQENQRVNKGDMLFSLDVESFDLAIAQAEVQLSEAHIEVAILKAALARQTVQLKAALENRLYAEGELARFDGLDAGEVVSGEKIAALKHALDLARHQVVGAKADIESARAELGGDPAQNPDDFPSVQQAKIALATARLDREYTHTQSGVVGIVAKINMHVGEYVQKGQPLFSIVKNDDVWVEANLKETQLTHIKVGQAATIEIDAYPGQQMRAKVISVAPASGAEYSILPPQNATGNWVKITQRIPVRLKIISTGNMPTLRAGMSAEISIDTGIVRTLDDLIK